MFDQLFTKKPAAEIARRCNFYIEHAKNDRVSVFDRDIHVYVNLIASVNATHDGLLQIRYKKDVKSDKIELGKARILLNELRVIAGFEYDFNPIHRRNSNILVKNLNTLLEFGKKLKEEEPATRIFSFSFVERENEIEVVDEEFHDPKMCSYEEARNFLLNVLELYRMW